MMRERSSAWMERARAVLPGGVSSPVRAFRSVGGEPFVVARGEGPYLFDEDGNRYIDFVMSWGALAHGHAHPAVVAAISRAAAAGTSFGAPTAVEVELAEEIRSRMPHVEMLRFVSSGSEATMSAVRLARAATGRTRILKFSGCYHGHADSFLVQAGSGVATLSLPDSPGVPEGLAKLTLSCEFNSPDELRAVFAEFGSEVAAIIVEPVIGNAGLIGPAEGYLQLLRDVADEHGTLLIFDEVMTGFRVAPGGAAEMSGVTPDLTTLGKVIGGGLPAAAFGGRRDLMLSIAPAGPVYQAGTLSGNPLAMHAGLTSLRLLSGADFRRTEARASALASGLARAAQKLGISMQTNSYGSMLGFFFSASPVSNFTQAKQSDVGLFRRFFHAALARGVYLAPSPFEALFLSTAHDDAVVDDALSRLTEALREAAA